MDRPDPTSLVSQDTDSVAEPESGAAIDSGTAGGSARREYERRANQRDERTKARWGGRLGGVVLALTNEPLSTAAWARGAEGEEKLARELADLEDVVVLHDRRMPGTKANIDHLVVAPGGVFVVDAKYYHGRIAIHDKGGLFRRDPRLFVGRRDCSGLADGALWQTQMVPLRSRRSAARLPRQSRSCASSMATGR